VLHISYFEVFRKVHFAILGFLCNKSITQFYYVFIPQVRILFYAFKYIFMRRSSQVSPDSLKGIHRSNKG